MKEWPSGYWSDDSYLKLIWTDGQFRVWRIMHKSMDPAHQHLIVWQFLLSEFSMAVSEALFCLDL